MKTIGLDARTERHCGPVIDRPTEKESLCNLEW